MDRWWRTSKERFLQLFDPSCHRSRHARAAQAQIRRKNWGENFFGAVNLQIGRSLPALDAER